MASYLTSRGYRRYDTLSALEADTEAVRFLGAEICLTTFATAPNESQFRMF
jgi:hypothetical protein